MKTRYKEVCLYLTNDEIITYTCDAVKILSGGILLQDAMLDQLPNMGRCDLFYPHHRLRYVMTSPGEMQA